MESLTELEFWENYYKHAREELEKGNRLQAGEIAWGAVVQPLKAIAAQRGWSHRSHSDIFAIASHLVKEYDLTGEQTLALSDAYRVGHENFYENYRSLEELAAMLDEVEGLMPALVALVDEPPRPFTIESKGDLDGLRLRRLTGDKSLQLGDTSEVGFSNNHLPPDAGRQQQHPMPHLATDATPAQPGAPKPALLLGD